MSFLFRNGWELSPDQFHISNEKFDDVVKLIVKKVAYELACDCEPVESTLTKAVLYGEGASIDMGYSFEYNLASTICDEYVTLVVQLPSLFTGNTLTIQFDEDEKRVVQFDRDNAEYEMFYAAFHSSCEYAMTPLESGYRLCLVYKLTWRGGMGHSLLRSLEQTQKTAEEISTKLSQVY